MEASIQEVARLTGTTSRTLRHYDAIGLLRAQPRRRQRVPLVRRPPRCVRLQRILLLRGLGLGLPDIRRVLEREQDETAALRHHLDWLRSEQRRLERQAASVERTITARENGGPLDGRGHVRRVRPHAAQGRGRAALGRGRVRVVRRLVARDERRRARRVEGDDGAARRRVGRVRPLRAPTRRPTRRRSSRGGTSRGSAASPGRPGTARRRSRSTCSAWPTCTSPTSGSPRTTAGSRARRSCVTRCTSTRRGTCRSARGEAFRGLPACVLRLACDRVTPGDDWTVAQHLPRRRGRSRPCGGTPYGSPRRSSPRSCSSSPSPDPPRPRSSPGPPPSPASGRASASTSTAGRGRRRPAWRSATAPAPANQAWTLTTNGELQVYDAATCLDVAGQRHHRPGGRADLPVPRRRQPALALHGEQDHRRRRLRAVRRRGGGASISSGARLILWPCHGEANQRWSTSRGTADTTAADRARQPPGQQPDLQHR